MGAMQKLPMKLPPNLSGFRRYRVFRASELGAVTVDMVLVMSAVIALGLGITGRVAGGMLNYANDTASFLAALETDSDEEDWEDEAAPGVD